jgi:exportin-5
MERTHDEPITDMFKAAADSLNAITGRMSLHDDDLASIIAPLYSAPMVELYRRAAEWAQLDPNDIDFDRNTYLKKHAEFVSHLASWVEMKPNMLSSCENLDLNSLFSLFWTITAHQSLFVSLPLMHLWARLLRSPVLKGTEIIQPYVPRLLELCTSRLVRYEQLPDEVNEPTFLFLAEDFDTLPDRHAFLGNYRRLCVEVIEVIVRQHPVDAVGYILNQSTQILQRLAGESSQTPKDFSTKSVALVMIDSQIQVVDAAVKGFLKWLAAQENNDPQQNEANRNQILETFKRWCEMIFGLNLKDPEILRRLVPVAVTISTKILKSMPSFATYIAEQLLSITLKEDPAYPQYSDAVKTLQHVSTIELQRLATVFADEFLGIFDAFERRIQENIAIHKLDYRPQLGYSAFLLIIIQRATTLDNQTRVERMEQMLMPVKNGWQDPALDAAAADFGSFCEFLGLGNLNDYLSAKNFSSVKDWSAQPLDEEGQALQELILNRNERIPIRITKAMLAATTDRAEPGTPAMEASRMLWSNLMPSILPNLLKMVSHAQAFYNMEKWAGLPEEMQQVIRRILTDRFWQVGISTESKDDFFAKVNNSKNSYEGLASTIRGTMRQVRESTYYILFCFTRFKENFYGISDLPEPLSQALYANAQYLSPHHFSVLVQFSGQLINGCPPDLRSSFLPSLLPILFRQIDLKLNAEWDLVNRRKDQAAEDDNLGDEMRTESILRQVTYNACQLAYSLLDRQRIG